MPIEIYVVKVQFLDMQLLCSISYIGLCLIFFLLSAIFVGFGANLENDNASTGDNHNTKVQSDPQYARTAKIHTIEDTSANIRKEHSNHATTQPITKYLPISFT